MRHSLIAVFLCGALIPPAVAQTTGAAPPDPARMSRQALEAEIAAGRTYIENGGVHAQRPPGCTSPETRQFDFWVGDWDVSLSGTEVLVGESTISMEDEGCDLIESWRPFVGAHGHSINAYDPHDRLWHQTWVDATGQTTNSSGTFDGGAMRLNNNSPPPPSMPNLRRRMNFQAIDANSLRQWGERFDEKTRQWTVAWDLTYRRRPGPHGR